VATIPQLRTDRLRLRGWRDADREPFADLNADPEVMEHFPAPLSREQSDAFLAQIVAAWADRGYGLWAVEQRSDRRFLGFVGLAMWAFDAPFMPAVEVGWRLARDAWGRGYATEAATAVLDWAFDVLGLDEIVSFTAPVNARSTAVMERLGMARDPADDFDHPRVPVGHPLRRHVLYRISRGAWQTRRAGAGSGPAMQRGGRSVAKIGEHGAIDPADR
jgi:RimJ/RimL family protein N-acetyltransferase